MMMSALTNLVVLFCFRCISCYAWEMVFKATSGGPFGIYDLFVSDSVSNVCENKAKRLDMSFSGHYKSCLLNQWTSLNITKVKVAVYKDNTEKAYFIFNGSNTDRTGWFSQANLIQTSYDISELREIDFPGRGKYFSIEGYPRVQRRFYINLLYQNCYTDVGWLMVTDSPTGTCTFDKFPHVTITYSPTGSSSTVREYEMADCLVVFIEQDKSQHVLGEAELAAKLENIKTEMIIDKQTTTKEMTKKTCAKDDRPSAQGIGFALGVGIISSLVILIFILDVPTLYKHVRAGTDRGTD